MTKKSPIKKTNELPTSGLLTRECKIRSESISKDERLIKVSFSSEQPVTRQSFFADPWVEVLGHDAKEANLERLNASAPVLYNHQRGENQHRIGVVERAWLEGGKGYAELRISRRDDVAGIWQDIEDGILRNVSVAYQIDERSLVEERANSPDLYRVTSWTPMEISLVDIPADHTVGVGRNFEPTQSLQSNQEENTMPKENQNPEIQERNIAPPADTSVGADVDVDAIRKEAANTALKQETARRNAIRKVFEPFNNEDNGKILQCCLDDHTITERKAKDMLLESLGANKEPKAREPSISLGESESEKFRKYAEEAITFRAGIADENTQPSELCGYTLLELARKSLELKNISTARMDKRELVGRAFTHSSSDFPILLANNARKSMLKGYSETEEVFSNFTSTGNLSDFKTHDRVGMSEFGSLDVIPEGGEYTHGTIGEHKEQIQLLTYGKMFSITRQAIINDDLNAFTEIPRKMGRAARRKVGDLVFSVLTDNPNMADGTALFHANHKNLAASGAAITAASLGAARTAMRTQKDASGNATLNIRPNLLIVPAALEDTARVLMASETDPSQSNSRKPNPVRGAFNVIVNARLDTASTTAWYLAANPSVFDVIEVGYLDGNPNPFLEEQDGWNIDGVEFKVRIDAAAKALEWRTLYKNPGA